MARPVVRQRQRDRIGRAHRRAPLVERLAGRGLGLRQQRHQRRRYRPARGRRKSAPIQSALSRAMARKNAPAFGGQADDLHAAVVRRRPPQDQALPDQPVDQAGDVAVRHHHALRQFAERHAVRRAVELRQQIEARQRDVEIVAQAAAHLVLDQRRAGEKTQPQPQLGLVVVGPLRDLGFGVERDCRSVVHHSSPPATISVVPVTEAASGEHR